MQQFSQTRRPEPCLGSKPASGAVQIDPVQWSELSRLLDQALEQPTGQLDRWLAALPPLDAVYRSQLDALLRQRAIIETGDFLDTLPKVSPPAALSTAVVAPGSAVGPYVVEEEIGRGGMGAVWRARRSDGMIKRPVALKLPHAGPQSQELIERFTRERDILGELTHPNIARLDDAGITEAGQPFLALEYVPGLPLTDYCDELRLNIRARLKLYLQALRAVQYAHNHLVIHRDLKPSNIIVTPEGQVMLVDFGIAKLIPDDDPETGTHTLQPGPALTPEYASPEQIAGQPVSTASDIYSLGVLLFELLTGERPYQLKRTSRAALEEAIIQRAAPRPSIVVYRAAAAAARATTVSRLARALRGDLDTIVLKALEKGPAQRYSSAEALSRDIGHYLRCEPVSARQDRAGYRLYKFVTRHKRAVAAVTGSSVALVASAALAISQGLTLIVRAEEDRPLLLPASVERAETPEIAYNPLAPES